jgi:hypothetical protein
MMNKKPTVDYCLCAIDLRWDDVIWAIDHGHWGWKHVCEFASFRLNDIDSPTFDIESQIVQLGKNDASEIMDLARGIAKSTLVEAELARRWEYIFLKWIFDKRDEIDNPFGEVEEVFADFGYPERMEPFISFLPPSDAWEPDRHSEAENRNRLLANWQNYLESSAKTLVGGGE